MFKHTLCVCVCYNPEHRHGQPVGGAHQVDLPPNTLRRSFERAGNLDAVKPALNPDPY